DNVLVICGDTPLIETDSLSLMVDKMSYSEGVIMTSVVENSFGYGRIMTDESGKFVKIVEEKDASEEEKSIKLINGGTYCIKGKILLDNLNKIKNNNNQNEYYLTEIFRFMNNVDFVQVNEEQLLGINSKIQLAQANRLMQIRINEKLMNDGVEIINPDVTYIDRDVKIGSGTIIYPNCHLRGYSIIGYNCEIMEDTTIENSVLRDNVIVKRSVIIDSKVGNSTTIGPYAYLRPNSLVGDNVKIGDFVEIKNASIGNGSKASHLSYIGDATIGKDVNIGCGVVFVNYDGKNKFKSIVNDNAFVGSNVNLVAPVEIGKSAYIATGTTVTVDIPDEALCIGRSRETIKSKWKKDK
ncbi:MAG: bifunctional UDP-N-acetylglucosamine diphosphorylase/glucosamine-1-phosphate N-acetyltransferase GlmU, partial [Filifactoraceae bacterium]